MSLFIPPSIVCLSGPSGAGKSALAGRILETHPNAHLVPRFTTRIRSESDIPGEFRYVSRPEFAHYATNGLFLTSTMAWERARYGTLTSHVREACERPSSISVMILEPDAVEKLHRFVREEYGDRARVLSIFIVQNNRQILRERLQQRGLDDAEIERQFEKEEKWFENATARDDLFCFVRGGDAVGDLKRVEQEILNEVDYTPY